jgi:hypothetical protein
MALPFQRGLLWKNRSTAICPHRSNSSHARKKILLKLHYSDAFFAPAVMMGQSTSFFVAVTG